MLQNSDADRGLTDCTRNNIETVFSLRVF